MDGLPYIFRIVRRSASHGTCIGGGLLGYSEKAKPVLTRIDTRSLDLFIFTWHYREATSLLVPLAADSSFLFCQCVRYCEYLKAAVPGDNERLLLNSDKSSNFSAPLRPWMFHDGLCRVELQHCKEWGMELRGKSPASVPRRLGVP